MSVNKKILFISHHKDVELGSMKNFFIEYKFDFDIIKPLHGETLPSNLEKWRGVIILGGAMNVGDLVEYPKLIDELNWIKNIISHQKSTLGICLGAQLIAKASGAKVGPHIKDMVEIGYKEVIIKNNNAYFSGFPKKVFHWHAQGTTLPNNAAHIATNSIFDIQAFSINNKIFGFQFHPEVTEETILNWNNKSFNMLKRAGASSKNDQLNDHKHYSREVELWFNNFLKHWLDLN